MRYQIVLGHYTFYSLNYSGQWCPFYERLCKISEYFTPSPLWNASDIYFEDNRKAFYIYNDLAEKHDCPVITLPDIELLINDHRGIYIPKIFAESYPDRITNDQEKILLNPEDDSYWEVWSEVLDNVTLENKDGYKYWLYQDGDLWAIPENWEYIDPEAYNNFFGDQ